MGNEIKTLKTGKNLSNWSSPILGQIKITSKWGEPRPYRGARAVHQGVDIRASEGTPVRAIGNGTVIKVVNNWQPGLGNAGGNYVSILHPGGILSEYMHLSRVGVTKGAKIAGGDYIGNAGSTGGARATKPYAKPMIPHLHFQTKGITADGIFGPQTATALRNYQQRAGLKVDGIFGSQTRAHLYDPLQQAMQWLR